MGEIKIRIEQLVLDNDNPRIPHSEGQQQTLQRVVRDQKMKLVRLAESIVEHGLSPIERLMIFEVNAKPKRYVALEGNRRVAALRLLSNPAAMTGLEMPDGMQKAMERLAAVFEKNKIEPIDCYEVQSRDEGRYWVELRHNGEDLGRGIVSWKPVVAARWRKRDPAIQALDAALEHGGFEGDEAEEIRNRFALSTLKRLIDSPEVQKLIGLGIEEGQLVTYVPAAEVIKPLKRFVKDIAEKKVNSRFFNETAQMVSYVKGLAKSDKPDLSKKTAPRRIDGLQKAEFNRTVKAKSTDGNSVKASSTQERRQIVPRNCRLNVTDNRINEIYKELRTLKLKDARNAIAVLSRVFLEMSVDQFLEAQGRSLSVPKPNGGERYKELDKKLSEVVEIFVAKGVPRNHFTAVIRSISVATSPMSVSLLHLYVHNRFATPSPAELTAAWDHAQPLFEKIWQ